MTIWEQLQALNERLKASSGPLWAPASWDHWVLFMRKWHPKALDALIAWIALPEEEHEEGAASSDGC